MFCRRRKVRDLEQGIRSLGARVAEVEDDIDSAPYISALRAGITTTRNGGQPNAVQNSRLLKTLMGDAASQGKSLWLDFPYAEFGEPIFFPQQLSGLVMRGNGAALGVGGTVLAWMYGPSHDTDPWTGEQVPSSFFHFANGRDFDFSGFTIQARHALGRMFLSSAVANEYTPPTNWTFRQVVGDGINGALNAGWDYQMVNGHDANGDIMTWYQCQAINLGRGQAHENVYDDELSFGWRSGYPQCRIHTLYGCSASQTGYQQTFNRQNFGLIHRSFNLFGGQFTYMDAAILQNGDSDPQYIQSINTEACRMFFDSTHGNRFSGQAVTIDTVRHAQDRAVDGDFLIRLHNPGQLTVRNFISDGPFKAMKGISYGPPAQGTPGMQNIASLIVEHCTFRTTSAPEEMIYFPNSVANNPAEGLDPNVRLHSNKIDTKINGIQTMVPILSATEVHY